MARKGQNWEWPFQNLGFGHHALQSAWGGERTAQKSVCPKSCPTGTTQFHLLTRVMTRKKHTSMEPMGQVKGRGPREGSQLGSQDILLSQSWKYLLIYSPTTKISIPLLLTGRDLHGERPHAPIIPSCPCLAGSWKQNSHRWLFLPALSITLFLVPKVWDAANGHYIPPEHPLAGPEIPAICMALHASKSTLY